MPPEKQQHNDVDIEKQQPVVKAHQRPPLSSSTSYADTIEPLSDRDDDPSHDGGEKSQELKRTVSNVLARVATHLTTASLAEPPPPPDGGVRAWTQVGCGWLIIFTTWGYVNSFGAFQTYYTQTLPESASTISWIGSVQVWVTFFTSAFSGRLLDAGMFTPTLAVGSVLQLLGIFLMSVSTQFWHLMLTQGVLTGIGGGLFFTPAMGLIATYFSKKRAVAVGLATLGNSVGGVVYPIVVREMLPRVGFGWTARVIGFINLICLLFANIFMKPRLPPRKAGPIIDWAAFKEPAYLVFVVGLFFMIWDIYYTFYFIASFGTHELGMSFQDATILVIVLNAVGFPARFATPFLADRVGCFNLIVPILAFVCIMSFCWLAVKDVAGFYVFTALFGFGQGAFQCLIPSSVANITPRLDMVGTRLGMAFTTVSFAALSGPPIGGQIQNAMGGSFKGANVWAAFATLIGLVLFAVTRGLLSGWKLKFKI